MGSPQCPDKAAVEAQLQALGPVASESSPRHLAMLEARAGGLEVRLFDEEGRLLEERFLPGPMTCDEKARVAAALLATWETNLAVPKAPLPAPPPRVQQVEPKAPESVPPKPPENRWRGGVGLGVSGSLASDGKAALGGEVWADLAPPKKRYGGELALAGTGYRTLAVQDGTANWQRFAVGLGGYGQLGSEPWRLQLGAAFLFGLLSLRGQGFVEPRADTVFDPGIGLSARTLLRVAPTLSTWLQLGATFWPKTHEAQVLAGSVTVFSTRVPPIELSLTLGVSLDGDL